MVKLVISHFFSRVDDPAAVVPPTGRGRSAESRDIKPKALDVGEVSIGSGSMSCTIVPLTVQRFSASFSRNRVPHGSARALHRKKSFAHFSGALRVDEKFEAKVFVGAI